NLVTALDEKQRAQAIFNKEAPAEIVTKNEPKIDPLAPTGIAAKAMTEAQRALLLSLIQQHNLRLHSALGKERLERATKAGLDKVYFAWAGGIAKGEKYYYR